MDSLVASYSRPAFEDEGYSSEEHQELIQSKPPLSLNFALPPMRNVSCDSTLIPLKWPLTVHQPSAFLRALTDDHANPGCPIKLAHGTTTLAFRFQGGIIVATDSRASAGDWIASQTVKKVIEINNCLLGTMAGGAAVSLDLITEVLTKLIMYHNRTVNTGWLTWGCNAVFTSSVTSAAYQSQQPRRSSQILSTRTRAWV